MSRGIIINNPGYIETVVNLTTIKALDDDTIYTGSVWLSNISSDEISAVKRAIEAYSPTPGPGPTPGPVIEPYYVPGWFEHQDGNWVLVKAGQTFYVDYMMTMQGTRKNKQYTASDVDTWFNVDNEEWINAEGIGCSNIYNTNSLLACVLDLPNNTNYSYTKNSLFYFAKSLINCKIKTKSLCPNFDSCENMVTCDLQFYDDTLSDGVLFGFQRCRVLLSLDFQGVVYNATPNQAQKFMDCNSLQSIKGLENWNVGNVTSMAQMFQNCNSLRSLDLSNWNVGNVTSMAQMFQNCNSLRSLDLSNWNVGNVTSTPSMFYGCSLLRSLDLTGVDISNFSDFKNTYVSDIKFVNLKVDKLIQITSEQIGKDCILNNESLQYLAEHLPAPITYEKTIYNITDFSVNLNDQWIESTYTNPDGSTYNMYMSNSNWHQGSRVATMFITINGNGHFKFYINSYGESKYDFTQVYELDSTTKVIANTKDFAKDPSGPIATNYKVVDFDVIDGGTHTIRIDYNKDGSGDVDYDRGFILVKKSELIPPSEVITVVEEYAKIGLATTQKQMTNDPYINILREKGYLG